MQYNSLFSSEKHESRRITTDDKKFYNCAFARKKGYGCEVKLKIVFSSTCRQVIVEKSENDHDHQAKSEINSLTDAHKKVIDEGLAIKKTAKPIMKDIRVNRFIFTLTSP